MSDPTKNLKKSLLRNKMRARLKLMSHSQRVEESAAICDTIISLAANSPISLSIASFIGSPTEPDLSKLFSQLPQHQFVYPRTMGAGEMHFHRLTKLNNLELGPYKIMQPMHDVKTLIHPVDIDLFLCPGLAFTESGKRLGKGGGYYDRVLAQRSSSSRLVGICFSNQIIQSLPVDSHDIELDQVISA